MRIKSLSDKIVLYFVTIGIIAIAVVSTYSFITSKSALLDRTFDQLTSVRVVKKKQVERFFQDRLSEIKLLSSSVEAEQLITNYFNSDNDPGNRFTLPEHLRVSGYYHGIYFRQSNGDFAKYIFEDKKNLSGSDPDDSDAIITGFFAPGSVQTGFHVHDYIYDSIQNRPRMFLSAMRNGNSSQPILVLLELSIEAINAIMLEKSQVDGLGASGESYLVGDDRLMRSTSRFQNNSIMSTEVNSRGVNLAFQGVTGTSVISDYRGISVLSSYSKLNIPDLNWAILAEIDYAEATSSIYFIRNNILFLTIFVGVIVLIISVIFSKRITLPLNKLTEATTNIRSGNLNINLPENKNDEIGLLTRSFNNMALTLRDKDAELIEERNKRFSAMIDGQEIERQRLSRELHDGLGQSLIALKLKLESIENKEVCQASKTLKEVKNSFDDTINEIRRISNDLMPAVLLEFGLITALKNICEEIVENSDLDLKFRYHGKFNDLDHKTTIYLFRIVQEALNNIVKHAGSAKAEVILKRSAGIITITVSDNGKGMFTADKRSTSGNGIPNMRERVRLLKGKIDIESDQASGTSIKIEIPDIKTENG
ncbi:MAG: sensor histidine kinase [Bacteroidales bacterium]|nr:sensor histidine kinase [Bacteroidales bacterium]